MPPIAISHKIWVFFEKTIKWVQRSLCHPGKVKFLDIQVTYCYSYPDVPNNNRPHLHQRTICSVGCALTIYNGGCTPKTIKSFRLSAFIGGVQCPMEVFDLFAANLQEEYTLPARFSQRATWTTIGYWERSDRPDFVTVNPLELPVIFQISYSDKTNRRATAVIEVAEPTLSDLRKLILS